MGKFIKLITIFLLMVLCCACLNNQNESKVAEPDYTVINDISDISDIMDNANNTNISDYLPDSNNADQEKWPYDLEYNGKGTLINTDFGNLGSNYKYAKKYSCLICPDKNNESVYYVNNNDNKYIYQMKDNKSTLLVEKEANCLQLWKNELYFISNNHHTEAWHAQSGDIYCYNLDTKELRLILRADAQSLCVDSYGIFYQNIIDLKTFQIGGFRLDFGSDTPYETDYTWYFPYKNCMLYNTGKEIALCDRDKKEMDILAIQNSFFNMCFQDYYFSFSEGTCIYVLNLKTGTKNVYNINDCESKSINENIIFDYVIANNIIYVSTGGISIYTIDLSTGEIISFTDRIDTIPDQNGIIPKVFFGSLFITEDHLYTLMSNTDLWSGDDFKLVELSLIDDPLSYEARIKELGK